MNAGYIVTQSSLRAAGLSVSNNSAEGSASPHPREFTAVTERCPAIPLFRRCVNMLPVFSAFGLTAKTTKYTRSAPGADMQQPKNRQLRKRLRANLLDLPSALRCNTLRFPSLVAFLSAPSDLFPEFMPFSDDVPFPSQLGFGLLCLLVALGTTSGSGRVFGAEKWFRPDRGARRRMCSSVEGCGFGVRWDSRRQARNSVAVVIATLSPRDRLTNNQLGFAAVELPRSRPNFQQSGCMFQQDREVHCRARPPTQKVIAPMNQPLRSAKRCSNGRFFPGA